MEHDWLCVNKMYTKAYYTIYLYSKNPAIKVKKKKKNSAQISVDKQSAADCTKVRKQQVADSL